MSTSWQEWTGRRRGRDFSEWMWGIPQLLESRLTFLASNALQPAQAGLATNVCNEPGFLQ